MEGRVLVKGLLLVTKRMLRSALQGLVRIPPTRFLFEHCARLICRRFPNTRLSAILMWQVSLALAHGGDDSTHVARLPGGSRLMLTLDEYSWRKLYFQLGPASRNSWLYERETTLFFGTWLRSGDTVIDVGANIGYFTILAAQMVGEAGAVHAFEPNPRVAALLRQSVVLNRFEKRVNVTEKAVSAHTGSLRFFYPTDSGNTYEATVVMRDDIALESLDVGCVSLDDYALSKRIDRVRLLKIDVEGAELDVLSGAARLLSEIRPAAVICEFAPRSDNPGQEWRALTEAFSACDYEPYRLDEAGSPMGPNRELPSWRWGNLCFLLTGNGRTPAGFATALLPQRQVLRV